MNLFEIKAYVRFILDEYGLDWLSNSDSDKYDLVQLIQDSYGEICSQVDAVRLDISQSVTSGTINVSTLGTYATRVNTTAYVVGNEIIPATDNGHKYICTTSGTTAGSIPTFQAITNSSVTDGTCVWKENGSSQAKGIRLYSIKNMMVDDKEMVKLLETQLTKTWKNTASGNPYGWFNYDASTFIIYPSPSASMTLEVSGYAYPDMGEFDSDTDIPKLPMRYHKTIAFGAIISVCTRNPNTEYQNKLAILQKQYYNDIEICRRELKKVDDVDFEFGSGVG